MEKISKAINKSVEKTRNSKGQFTSLSNKAGILSKGKNIFKKKEPMLSIPGEKGLQNSKLFKNSKCTPTTFYLVFAGLQIFMDLINGVFVGALVKFFIMIVFSTLLNILCMRDLGIISWLLVFMPFILMTLISALVLDSVATNDNRITTDYINFNIN
jgi:sensor histidine kinase YesM